MNVSPAPITRIEKHYATAPPTDGIGPPYGFQGHEIFQ